MLHVNEDNDELYRSAAEHYPLNTDNPDWTEVLKKMEEASLGSVQATVITKKRNYRPFFLILLLIPISILDNKHIEQSTGGISQNNSAHKNNAIENKPAPLSNDDAVQAIAGVVYPTGNKAPLSSQPRITSISPEKKHPSAKTRNIAENKPTGTTHKLRYQSDQRSAVAINTPATERDDLLDPAVDTRSTNPISKDPKESPLTLPDKKDNSPKKATVEQTLKTDKAVVNKETEKRHSTKKRVYIGLLAGPDISAVKLQPVKNLGFNIGLIAGYRLNRKFSIESGVSWVKKFYTSDGKYFNTKNIPMPDDARIKNLQGECHMLEVPLNISYTFISGPRSSWFATTGVSAYLMKSESYMYDITRYGNTYPYYKEYDNPSTNLFSVINISAGYTHRLGRIGDLRIEPYIKIPVRNIGTGSLPIQSTGINIGLTKNIF